MKKLLIILLACFLLTGCATLSDPERNSIKVYNDCPWVITVYISNYGIPLMWDKIEKQYKVINVFSDTKIKLKIQGPYDLKPTTKRVEVPGYAKSVVIDWSSYYDDYVVSAR